MIDFTFFGTFFCRISDWSDEENLMQYWIVIVRIGLDIELISFGFDELLVRNRLFGLFSLICYFLGHTSAISLIREQMLGLVNEIVLVQYHTKVSYVLRQLLIKGNISAYMSHYLVKEA